MAKKIGHPANQAYHISSDGLKLITEFEGLYLKAYRDGGGVWTIGWGTTNMGPNGHVVWAGREITRTQAEAYLAKDMEYFENVIKRVVKVPLTQHQFDAMVSFTYNLGEGTLGGSELLKMLNRGNYDIVPGMMLRYDHDDGVQVSGLTRRRKAEGVLFLTGDVGVISPPEQSFHDDGENAGLSSSVIPSGMSKQPWTMESMLTQSDTIKGVVIAVTGLISTVGALIGPILHNPWVVSTLILTLGGLTAIVVTKVRDTNAGR